MRVRELAAGQRFNRCVGSEVVSRIDQLDKCRACGAAVSRGEAQCPRAVPDDIKRNNEFQMANRRSK